MSGLISKGFERRFTGEVRVDLSDDRHIRGHAIVFNSVSVNLGGFREIIKPEAVDRTLQEAADVRALWNHESGVVLGRTRAGTLALTRDARGLRVDIDPPSWAGPQLESIARGDVTGMSFGFHVLDDEWRDGDDGIPLRLVSDMRVSEVSIVTFPAYTATDVTVAQRSAQEYQRANRARVDWLKRWHKTRLAG